MKSKFSTSSAKAVSAATLSRDDRQRCVDVGKQCHYEVNLLPGLLQDGAVRLADSIGPRKTLLVTTPTVARLYGMKLQAALSDNGVDLRFLMIDCDENGKSVRQVEDACRHAQEQGLDRKSVLLAFGGGVCSDIVTVAASWIRRGITHMRIPTTLIGAIDAGIGVKGGVNFSGKKSALGCFHPPESVWIDPEFLGTLPRLHLACGLAEAVKMAILKDARLFELIETHAAELLGTQFSGPREPALEIVWRSIERMLEELEVNLFEDQTYERLVDFGHTFSPLLEARSGFRIPHGEAVSIDMAFTATIAEHLGLLDADSANRIVSTLLRCGLPVGSVLLSVDLCRAAIVDTMRHRGGALNLVVPTALGQATFLRDADELPMEAIRAALTKLADRCDDRRLRIAA